MGLVIVISVLAPDLAAEAPGQTAAARQSASPATGISGRVINASGQPVPGTVVTLLRRESPFGALQLVPVNLRAKVTTGPKGEFVFQHIPAGPYFLVALPQNSAATPNNRPNRSGYAITYYPNAATAAGAKSVTVIVGPTVTANITLAPAYLFGISGSVIASDGRPPKGAVLGILHGNGLSGVDAKGVPVRVDGTFQTAGLPPGTYFLQMREGVWPPPADVIPKLSGAKVTISDRDIEGIRVAPIDMVHVTGRVVVDRSIRSLLTPASVEISATPADFESMPGPQRPGILKNDFTFEFRTWPGQGNIRVALRVPGWAATAIRLKGVDVKETGVNFQGKEMSGLEIELVKGLKR